MIGGLIQKTRIPKIQTQFVHEPSRAFFVYTKPAKVSWEGTQLEVARAQKFCKAVWQIKNADPFTKESAGAGSGRIGTSANTGLSNNGSRLTGAPWALPHRWKVLV